MTKENPFQQFDRLSKYSRADWEKVARSTPERRRRHNRIMVISTVGLYLMSMALEFFFEDHDTRRDLIVDVLIPDPFAAIFIALFAGSFGVVNKSKLTDKEACAVYDEVEEMQRKDQEFAKWLWLGDKHKPDWMNGNRQKPKDTQHPKTE